MDEMTTRRMIRTAGFNAESLRGHQRGDGAETIVRTFGTPEHDRFLAWVTATPEIVVVRWVLVDRSGRTTTAFYVRTA